MNRLNSFAHALLSIGLVVFSVAASVAAAAVPDERDRQVLQAVLLRLLKDPEFDMTRVPVDAAEIVLHAKTPEKIAYITARQIRIELGERRLPSDAEEDLRRRNTPTDAAPDSYDGVAASYYGLAFAQSIVVADLSSLPGGFSFFRAFDEAHPKARGFVRAHLPGYSKDGTRAVVRAGIGPSPHGAMLTAELERRGEQWVVLWHQIVSYV